MFCNGSYDAGRGSRPPCASRSELGATGTAPGAALPAFCASPGLCSLLGQSLCPLRSTGLELEAVYPHLVRLQSFLCLPPGSAVFWGKASSTLGTQAVLSHLERLQPTSQDVSLQDMLLGYKPCLCPVCSQHAAPTPANHCPQAELGQVQLCSLRVLQHHAKDRTFQDSYGQYSLILLALKHVPVRNLSCIPEAEAVGTAE